MAHASLEDFIKAAAAIGEAEFVDGADLAGDVGCLTELFAEHAGPMLVFDNFAGHKKGFRVSSNALKTPKRFALAMGFPVDSHPVDLCRMWKDRRKKLGAVAQKEVSNGPVLSHMQRGEDVDLTGFPAPLWHSGDGGRYIGTGDMVIVRDPDEGWVNIGVYRGMLQGPKRLSLWINPMKHGRIIIEKYWAQGRNAPVAVVLGCDPLTWMTAGMSPPYGTSEYEVAGAYRGEPVEVVRLRDTGLPVPAHAEIVIEGEMPPLSVESAFEGPFGEWPGYYTHQGFETVVRINAIHHRDNPILLGMPPVRPLGSGGPVGVPTITPQLWEHLERGGITDIAGVWSFCSQLMVVIALKQRYSGHANQALLTAAGFRHGDMKAIYVAVDEDIDPSNMQEVVWAITTRCDPARQVEIIRHAWTAGLDPRVSPAQREAGDLTAGRMLIDACKPFAWRDKFPKSNVFSQEERKVVEAKWEGLLGRLKGR